MNFIKIISITENKHLQCFMYVPQDKRLGRAKHFNPWMLLNLTPFFPPKARKMLIWLNNLQYPKLTLFYLFLLLLYIDRLNKEFSYHWLIGNQLETNPKRRQMMIHVQLIYINFK